MQTIFSWASDHWVQLGVGSGLITVFSRAHRLLNKLVGYGDTIEDSERNLNLMMTNHLPHLQGELEQANSTLRQIHEDNKGLRDDIRAVLTRIK